MKKKQLTPDQQALAVQWTGLVEFALKRWAWAVVQLGRDEARSVAYLALTVAARNYDPAHGVQFNTYALRCIWSQFARAVSESKKGAGQHEAAAVGMAGARREWSPPFSLSDDERAILGRALRRLTRGERAAVKGFLLKGETLKVIGARLGISTERVRQLRNKGVEKLRGYLSLDEGGLHAKVVRVLRRKGRRKTVPA